jgi:hypothetical protein
MLEFTQLDQQTLYLFPGYFGEAAFANNEILAVTAPHVLLQHSLIDLA